MPAPALHARCRHTQCAGTIQAVHRSALNPSPFQQTHNICVLASYAIAAEYLLSGLSTVVDFLDAVVDEARRLGRQLPSQVSAPRQAVALLALGSSKPIPWGGLQGFQRVEWLHSNSQEQCFVAARKAFDVQYLKHFSGDARFTAHTSSAPWLALVAQQPSAGGFVHALCAGGDGAGDFAIETDFRSAGVAPGTGAYGSNGAFPVQSWTQFGSPGASAVVPLDGLLIKPKTWPSAEPPPSDSEPGSDAPRSSA